ncbi:MAG: nuclear transport factor 2 family protein [Microcystaceae cyanobacterium]
MSQSNPIPLAQQFYDAINQGNLENLLDCFTDEIDWYGLAFESEIRPKKIQGKPAMKEYMQASMKRLKRNWMPNAFVPHENQVIVTGHAKYEALETGFTFENEWVHILNFKEGKIAEFKTYIDVLTLLSLMS